MKYIICDNNSNRIKGLLKLSAINRVNILVKDDKDKEYIYSMSNIFNYDIPEVITQEELYDIKHPKKSIRKKDIKKDISKVIIYNAADIIEKALESVLGTEIMASDIEYNNEEFMIKTESR